MRGGETLRLECLRQSLVLLTGQMVARQISFAVPESKAKLSSSINVLPQEKEAGRVWWSRDCRESPTQNCRFWSKIFPWVLLSKSY